MSLKAIWDEANDSDDELFSIDPSVLWSDADFSHILQAWRKLLLVIFAKLFGSSAWGTFLWKYILSISTRTYCWLAGPETSQLPNTVVLNKLDSNCKGLEETSHYHTVRDLKWQTCTWLWRKSIPLIDPHLKLAGLQQQDLMEHLVYHLCISLWVATLQAWIPGKPIRLYEHVHWKLRLQIAFCSLKRLVWSVAEGKEIAEVFIVLIYYGQLITCIIRVENSVTPWSDAIRASATPMIDSRHKQTIDT